MSTKVLGHTCNIRLRNARSCRHGWNLGTTAIGDREQATSKKRQGDGVFIRDWIDCPSSKRPMMPSTYMKRGVERPLHYQVETWPSQGDR